MTVQMKGEEPKGNAADLMYVAMQVCLNNAIQYAQATELSINVWENAGSYTVMISNDGKSPEKVIIEGGGLTDRDCGRYDDRAEFTGIFFGDRYTKEVTSEKGG